MNRKKYHHLLGPDRKKGVVLGTGLKDIQRKEIKPMKEEFYPKEKLQAKGGVKGFPIDGYGAGWEADGEQWGVLRGYSSGVSLSRARCWPGFFLQKARVVRVCGKGSSWRGRGG